MNVELFGEVIMTLSSFSIQCPLSIGAFNTEEMGLGSLNKKNDSIELTCKEEQYYAQEYGKPELQHSDPTTMLYFRSI